MHDVACEFAQTSLRPWQTRTYCCGHIVAHDVYWAAQTGKHLLRTQSVSEQSQKPFLCPGHKICVRNKCCARRQTGKHLCQQQCVRDNVSSFARAFKPNLAEIQPENHQNVRKMHFWQKSLGVNGFI